MRKRKGYQREGPRDWWNNNNSYAKGEQKSIEQIIEQINRRFDERIEECKKEYEKISNKTILVGHDLRKYCRDWMLNEVKFDYDLNKNTCELIPLEKAIETLNEHRRRCLSSKFYKSWDGYQRRIIHKDNQKFVYNTGSGNGGSGFVRVPSLKRSDSVWRRFYELFPNYEEMSHDPEKRLKYHLKKL